MTETIPPIIGIAKDVKNTIKINKWVKGSLAES